MQKNFWLVIVLVLGGLFGLFILTGEKDETTEFSTYDPTIIRLEDEITGLEVEPKTQEELEQALKGKAVIVEYADFQCPACGYYYGLLDQIKKDFAGDLVVVFRHFPISSIHPQAMAAHRASVAASEQGKFWEMHDLIYSRQQDWSEKTNAPSLFKNYADELDLDPEQYNEVAESVETFDLITNDIKSAEPYGITGTPSFIVNGELLEKSPTYEELAELIQSFLDS